MNKENADLVRKYGYDDISLDGMKLILIKGLKELSKGLSFRNTRKFLKIRKFLCPNCSQKNQATALLLTYDKTSLFCPNCSRTFYDKEHLKNKGLIK